MAMAFPFAFESTPLLVVNLVILSLTIFLRVFQFSNVQGGDGGVIKEIIKNGKNWEKPEKDDKVTGTQ